MRPLPGLLLKNLLLVALFPGTVAILIPYLLTGFVSGPWAEALGEWRLLGWLWAGGGAALLLGSVFGFAAVGKGTLAPVDAPTELVVCGPYRWVRNPMYVGVLGILAGESLALGSPAILLHMAVMWGVFHLFVALYEEHTLRRRFGKAYERFLERVPRWIPLRLG